MNRARLRRLEALESIVTTVFGFKALLRSEWDRLLSVHGNEEDVKQALGVHLVTVVDEDPPGGDDMAVWAVEALEAALQRPGENPR